MTSVRIAEGITGVGEDLEIVIKIENGRELRECPKKIVHLFSTYRF